MVVEVARGYELIDDIDLKGLLDTGGGDADEANGMIDTKLICIDTDADATDDCVNADDDDDDDDDDKQVTVIDTGTGKDTSWVPIGDSTTEFTGIFEGNNHTIANLWVNGSFKRAGLFGETDGTVEIRNVGIISGSVHSSSSSRSGGLVGFSGGSLTITNSYFSGSDGVSASSGSSSSSGGLVGVSASSLMIVNSYFSGSGEISSASDARSSSGGLVGESSSALTITNGYWNIDASQSVNGVDQTTKRAQGNAVVSNDVVADVAGATGLTLTGLKATSGTYPSGLPSGATENTKAWDLGTNEQLPAIKRCVSPITDAGVCTLYGALISGQR